MVESAEDDSSGTDTATSLGLVDAMIESPEVTLCIVRRAAQPR